MKEKVAISERALTQRINRKLASDMKRLCKARGNVSRDVGDYYVINYRINAVMQKDVDVEKLARELGVLKAWETVTWE